jgi:hypothetical protein
MRIARISLLALILALFALPALAQCPLLGTYTTQGGELLMGHASESWPYGAPGQLENAVTAQSWDGFELGNQWYLSCPETCVEPVVTEDTIDEFGNGQIIYLTQYCTGVLWLEGDGTPWSDGHDRYLADVLEAIFFTTVEYADSVPVGRTTQIQISTDVVDCTGVCINVDIQTATELGQGIGSDFPAGYPYPVLAEGCNPDPTLLGTWWDVTDITMSIEGCSVPVREAVWSEVKALYR